MTDAAWKNCERKIADLLGGKRVGPTGTPQPDVVSKFLVAEVKHRASLPRWLFDAVEQAREQRDVQRMPIVVLHQKGQRYDHSLIVVRLDDFVQHVRGAGDGHRQYEREGPRNSSRQDGDGVDTSVSRHQLR